jgi:RNA recognition motif-containing protein
MIKNWQTKKFKGFVYIDYKDNGSVKKAITKYQGKKFKGRHLICDPVTTSMKKGFKRFMNPDEKG